MAKVLLLGIVGKHIEEIVLKTPVRWDCPTENCDGKPTWADYIDLINFGVPRCQRCNTTMVMKDAD